MKDSERCEILELDPFHGEFCLAKVAVNEVPSVPFFVHKSVREKYPREDDFIAYLRRMGAAVIQRCGDARNPKPDYEVEGRVN